MPIVLGGCDIHDEDTSEREAPAAGWARREVRVLALVLALGVTVVVVLAALAVTRVRDDIEPPDVATTRYLDAHAGLCRSLTLVQQGSVEEAGRVFTDETHATLHQLVDSVNRRIARRMLESKAAVEAGFRGEPSTPLPESLSRLSVDTAAAIASTGAATPPPCTPRPS